MLISIGPLNMSCLDTNISINFISEDNTSVIFNPIDAIEFSEYLEQCEPGIIQNIFDGTINQETVEFLQEAVYTYLEENQNYYNNVEQLAQFIIESNIAELYITLKEEDQLDLEIKESVNSFFDTEGWSKTTTVLESVEGLIEEAMIKKMVRGGQIIKRIECPPGFKLSHGQCVRMGATEVRKRMKAAFKATKTRRKHMQNAMFARAIMKKRNKSMKVGDMRGLY